MLVWESVLSALSLSMDAFAVALCLGASVIGADWKTALRMGVACGAFQFFMPLVGWLLGEYAIDYIESFDHWIAFALLAFVGGNMVRGSFAAPDACDTDDPTKSRALLYLALATSIDALAVGASFAIVDKPVTLLAGCAGVATAALCFVGIFIGRFAGDRLGKRVELAGGLILFLIGGNILWSHLAA